MSHKEWGLSNLHAGDPFNSSCGYSLRVFFSHLTMAENVLKARMVGTRSILHVGILYVFFLVDVSDIFYFFCSGEGKGVRGHRNGVGGIGFLLKMPGAGVSQERGGGPKGREGVCGEFGGGGGAKYFFFWGRNAHQVFFFFAPYNGWKGSEG